jgi:hypothetical protein
MRKNDVPVPVDDSKRCPLEVYYDADVHDALSNLRKLDGDIVSWTGIFQCTLSIACLLIFAPQNRASTGPSPLLRNWGTLIRTFCIILIVVNIFIIVIY